MGSFVSLGAYTWLSSLLLTVVNAALVGVVGWLLIKFLLGFIAKFLKKTKIDPLLHTVILSVTKIALLVLLAISVLDKLGIPTTSIITSLGAVGLAISLAVKDSIATLAGGVVILVLKPFNLGDYVEIDGLGGTVREITMFNTVLNTRTISAFPSPMTRCTRPRLSTTPPSPTAGWIWCSPSATTMTTTRPRLSSKR